MDGGFLIPNEWLWWSVGIVPTIKAPERKVKPREKMFWTIYALVTYLICCQIPLYGTRVIEGGADPFEYMRQMIASQRGTLMEFGIMPLFTTSTCLQMLRITGAIEMDTSNKAHWKNWEGFEKFCTLLFCGLQSYLAISNGLYGELPTGNAIIIGIQLTFASFLVILLDEVTTKYGHGSATSMFIACSHAERIVWDMFSPTTINMGTGPQFEGAVINLVHQLVTQGDKLQALRQAFYRERLTNLMQISSTLTMIAITAYLSGMRLDLPLVQPGSRGQQYNPYKIKLIYAGNYPVIIFHSLLQNLWVISKLLKGKGQMFMLKFVGDLGPNDVGRIVGKNGLIYWMSSPSSLSEFITNPWDSILKCLVIIFCIAVLSVTWIEMNGRDARAAARSIANAGLTIKGFRGRSVYKVLNRYIPTCAMCGGMILGLLTITANCMGSLSSGSGTLMAVGIVISMYEKIQKSNSEGSDLISHRHNTRWDF